MTTFKTNKKRQLRKQQTKSYTITYLIGDIANIKPKTMSTERGQT